MKAFEIITDRILSALDNNIIPWRKPWKSTGGIPRNFVTGKPYRGLNIFLTLSAGYSSPFWLTYNQAKERGGTVRKGEKGTPIIYWNFISRPTENAKGEIEEQNIPFMRYYTVFNVNQIDGLKIEETPETFNEIIPCEDVLNNMPQAPTIIKGFDQACYNPISDTVKIPSRAAFKTEAGYYATLFHELSHSTGHASRLARKGITERNTFGSDEYSKEELVAELGAAFLCGFTGIEAETLENQTAYIDNWKKVIAADKKMIISAAAQAQRAADFILNRAQTAEQTASDEKAA